MRFSLVFFAFACLPFGMNAEAADKKSGAATSDSCSYQIINAKPGWTAYKTTEKAAVSGTFNEYQFASTAPAASMADAFTGLNMSITPASVESNNAPRNATIASKYFALFANPSSIRGKVLSVTGDDTTGTVAIQIDMNAVSKDLDFNYSVTEDGKLEASVTVDMMDFALDGPWASIHETCKALHTGADGVAKTWTEVMLKVTADVAKICK
ncbi:MAG: YceI family protein [Myxococcota bacterium]